MQRNNSFQIRAVNLKGDAVYLYMYGHIEIGLKLAAYFLEPQWDEMDVRSWEHIPQKGLGQASFAVAYET